MSRGAKRDDLAAQLGANRAAGAGDQHRRPGHESGHRLQVDLGGLSPQQVFELDLADLAHAGTPAQNLEQSRQRAAPNRRRVADAHDRANRLARRGGHGDDDLIHPTGIGQAGDVFPRPQHLDAVNGLPLFPRVVVHQTHGDEVQRGVVLKLPQDHGPRRAGAGDEHPPGLAVGRAALALARASQVPRQLDRKADATQQADAQHPLEHHHRPRKAIDEMGRAQHAPHQPGQHRRADGGGRDDGQHLGAAGVLPHAPIEPEKVEYNRINDDGQRKDLPVSGQAAPGSERVEAKHKAQNHGDQDQSDVHDAKIAVAGEHIRTRSLAAGEHANGC